MPGEVWALLGVLVTAVVALLRERVASTSSPYEAMAKRLAYVEAKAAQVPSLTARLELLSSWIDEAAAWMVEVEAAWKDQTGEHYIPAPPLPPPPTDRRLWDFGPPSDGERRGRSRRRRRGVASDDDWV